METRAQLGAVPRTAIVLAVLGLLLAIFAGAMVAGSGGDSQAANGRIAFADRGDIFSINPDGSDRQLLVEGVGDMQGLSWSPDGTRLAYWSADTSVGPWTLTVVEADGSDPVIVASDVVEIDGNLTLPEWSPDGSQLAFTARTIPSGLPPCAGAGISGVPGEFCSSRVFVAAADGSTGAVQVGDPDMDARTVAWSPDGSTLAFGGGHAADGIELYLMAPDGSDIRRLGEPAGNGWAFLRLDWSPDGEHIVATAGQEEWDIWAFAADGSGAVNLSNEFGDQLFPTYASDDALAWWGGTETGGALVVLEEGGEPTRVEGWDGVPVWSPDGELIATTRTEYLPGGNLTLLDRDGNIVTTITDVGSMPSWQRLPG